MADTEIVIEPGRQDIVITRVFDAPRDVVFKAYTDPTLISQWWGGSLLTTEVDRMEVRPGGLWRYTTSRDDGTVYGFKGVYHDVVAPEQLIYTFEFEPGGPGHLQLVTDTFTEVDGRTKFVGFAVFQSVEDRDAWIPSGGLDAGTRDAMDRLDEIIHSLR